ATVSFGYTPTGRRDQVIDPRGLTDYGYDTRDRMTSIVYPDGSSIVYTYDAAGNLATMQSTVGSTSWTETYGYNERNELTSVEVDSLVFTLSYDETGQVSSIAYPNGVTTTYTYDDVDRLASIVTANDQATVLASYAYTRYPDGNIETITEADGTLYDYAYDEANRLVQATVTSSTSALVYAEGFAFDAAGNRSTRFYTPASGVQETYSYSYDSRDRIQSDATDSYAFDDDGRMVSRGVQALTWNSQDHLVSIDYGDGRFATNSYDTDGVLVAAQLAGTSGTSSATQYLNSLRRDRLPYTIADIDANTGAVVRRFVRAEGTLVGVLGVGGSVAYIHTDHLRSVRATTDATGGVMNATSYAPNGSLQSGAQEPFGYAGERADEASGLGYHRARWLEPNLGMFLSRDPAGGLAGRPASLGSYSYANGDPTNVVDPSGEFGLREVVLVAGIAATLAEIAYVNWSAVRSVIIGGKKISLQTQGIPSEAVFSAAAVAAENELRSVYGPFGFEVNRNGSTFGGHTVQWSRGEGVCHDRGFDAVTPVGSRRSIIKVENIRACLRDIRGTQRSMATENDELIGLLTLTSVHETLHGLRGDQLHRDNGSPNLLMSGPRALGMVLDAGGTFTLSGLKGAGFFTLEPADADRISTR
ncbi:MAG: RHS repeat-associated core domain-containing protein, partial [Deltaproteobacteria bacterium]